MATSNTKVMISSLSPELVGLLKEQTDGVLGYLINTNSATVYFREAPLLSELRTVLQETTRGHTLSNTHVGSCVLSPQMRQAFVKTVPLSTYEDYRPFVDRLMKPHGLLSDVSDMLSPGLPAYVVSSSGTSTGAGPAKFFLKYRHPPSTSSYAINAMKVINPTWDNGGGPFCVIYNLRHSNGFDATTDSSTQSKTANKIPICFGSSAMVRLFHGWSIDLDQSLKKIKAPNTTSPLAICFIHSYQSSLLMHGLFALADSSLRLFNTIFTTTFVDLMYLLQENWDILVQAIDSGVVPKLDGVADLYDNIQHHFTPNPHRAAQLRIIGNDISSPGWAERLWPSLKCVFASGSGTFASAVPQARHYLGNAISLQSIGLACSEGWLADPYDPTRDLNLYSMCADDFLEYLDICEPEDAVHLKRAWEVEIGRNYEIVLTTRDGFWRYRLGDVMEVAGFNPTDGQPIMRYKSRRNVVMRASGEHVTERELMDAVQSLGGILGDITEYTVVIDDRRVSRAYGFLMELRGEIGGNASSAMSRLDDFFQSTNTTYAYFRSSGHLGLPTIRMLALGTFGEYREWKTQGNVIGSGQIKVPTVTLDDQAVKWIVGRVVKEILL